MSTETMTLATPSGLHNHWRCEGNCVVNGPLTLGDHELISGRSHRDRDGVTGIVFCADCLADLPNGLAQISHVCAVSPQIGDVVRYHGSLEDYHGSVWEVTCISAHGRLTLFDVDRAMRNVHATSVTVVGRKHGSN